MRRRLKILGAVGFGLVLIAALLLGIASGAGESVVAIPTPSGEYAVGRRIVDWTDMHRVDPFDPKRGFRRLNIYIWYPATTVTNAKNAPYQPGEDGWGPAAVGTQFEDVAVNSVANAPVTKSASEFHVLIMQPGLGGTAGNYTTLAEELASHGYVVFGINPTYSTDVHFNDGTTVHSINKARDYADFKQLGRLWAGDALFVAEQVQSGSDLPQALQNRLASSRVGFFGHSLGGSAALGACAAAASCIGAVNIDGDIGNANLHAPYSKPLLFLGHDASLKETPADLKALQALAKQDKNIVAVTVRGTNHFNFEDRAMMYDPLGHLLRIFGRINGTRGLLITRETLVDYFDTVFANPPRRFAIPALPELQSISLSASRRGEDNAALAP